MSLDTHTKINRHVQIPLGLCQGRACDVKKKKKTPCQIKYVGYPLWWHLVKKGAAESSFGLTGDTKLEVTMDLK